MLVELKDSNAPWQNIDSKKTLLDSASNGDVDSLSLFLKLLTFHGESTTPYIRRISTNPNNPFTQDTIEPIQREAIQYVHQNIINPFDVDTFPNKELLNIKSLKGRIDYDREGILYIRSPQMTILFKI